MVGRETSPRGEPRGEVVELLEPLTRQPKLPHQERPPVPFEGSPDIQLNSRALRSLRRSIAKSSSQQPPVKRQRTRGQVIPAADYLSKASQEDIDRIKDFAQGDKQGGPDLTDLRGYREPGDPAYNIASVRQSFTSARTSSEMDTQSRKVSAYNQNFENHLIKHGIYPPKYHPDGHWETPVPKNLDEIRERLLKRRPSLSLSSFTNSAFLDFEAEDSQVVSESMVMSTVLPAIRGPSSRGSTFIPYAENILFNKLRCLTDGSIMHAKPDGYDGVYGYTVEEDVLEVLRKFIHPNTGSYRIPVLPSFFVEAKAPKGDAQILLRQGLYDGAMGARGIQALQSYIEGGSVYDGNTYTIVATYHYGILKMYVVHCVSSAEDKVEYYMRELGIWSMSNNMDDFRKGATAFRNARDWAREQRDKLVAQANSKAKLDAERAKAQQQHGIA